MLIGILQAHLTEITAITDKKAVVSNAEMSKLHGALADA
jgi:hypothetical protein